MADFKVMFSKIADDLPQVINPETGEYFGVENYKWAFLIKDEVESYWDDSGGYGYILEYRVDEDDNDYYERDFGSNTQISVIFIPEKAYFGQDKIKLEKGLYIGNRSDSNENCYAVRLIDINTEEVSNQ